jgi:hypothetical protein
MGGQSSSGLAPAADGSGAVWKGDLITEVGGWLGPVGIGWDREEPGGMGWGGLGRVAARPGVAGWLRQVTLPVEPMHRLDARRGGRLTNLPTRARAPTCACPCSCPCPCAGRRLLEMHACMPGQWSRCVQPTHASTSLLHACRETWKADCPIVLVPLRARARTQGGGFCGARTKDLGMDLSKCVAVGRLGGWAVWWLGGRAVWRLGGWAGGWAGGQDGHPNLPWHGRPTAAPQLPRACPHAHLQPP